MPARKQKRKSSQEDTVKVDIEAEGKDFDQDNQEKAVEPDEVEETSAESENTADGAQGQEEDELAQAKALAAAMQDKYLRLQAEWDNFRKRTAQEAESQRVRATERLLEALIPVIDDLERALEHAHKTEPQDEFKAFVDGIAAVHDKFVSTLENKAKLEVIDPKGEPFDALKHQAVGTVENKDEFDETVAEVYQKGYELGGYVIRPAMVTVTTGGKPRPQED